MSKFTNYLLNSITSDQVNHKEAKRLGHVVEVEFLNNKILLSGRKISNVTTPSKPIVPLIIDIPENVNLYKRPANLTRRSLSFEDLEEDQDIELSYADFIRRQNLHRIMSDFSTGDFNRMIPEYKGDVMTLPVFLKRCETFHSTLNNAGKAQFLSSNGWRF